MANETIPSFMWTLPRRMQKKIVECSIKQEREYKKSKDVRVMYTNLCDAEFDPELVKIKSGTSLDDLKKMLKLKKDTKLMYDGTEIMAEDWTLQGACSLFPESCVHPTKRSQRRRQR